MKNKSLGAKFLLKTFFGNFNFKTTTLLLDSGPIIGRIANFVRPFE